MGRAAGRSRLRSPSGSAGPRSQRPESRGSAPGGFTRHQLISGASAPSRSRVRETALVIQCPPSSDRSGICASGARPTIACVEHRATAAIESDIGAIESFASSYRAYWGVQTDGRERDPVKDRTGLRHRLHRQLPRIEKVMLRAGTNGFGFRPPPIARGAPPRLGIVAVAFADEDPVYSVGGGPPCFEEVLNRLEMTLGVLETELEEAKHSPPLAQAVSRSTPKRAPESGPEPQPTSAEDQSTPNEPPRPVEVVEAAQAGAGPGRVFAHGVRRAWAEARAARGGSSLRGKVEMMAAIATIVGTVAGLGVLLGWWGA
jgi:hypothetical protein